MRTGVATRHSLFIQSGARTLAVALLAGFAVLGSVTLAAAPASAAEFVVPEAPSLVEAVCAPDGRSQTVAPTATVETNGVTYVVESQYTHGSSIYVRAWADEGFEFPEVLPEGWEVLTPGLLASWTGEFEYCFHRTGEVVVPTITNATETCVAGEQGPILPPTFTMPAVENASLWVNFYDENYDEVDAPVLGGGVEAWLSPDPFFQLPKIVPAEWSDEGDGHLFEATFGLTVVDCSLVPPVDPGDDTPDTPTTDTPTTTTPTAATPVLAKSTTLATTGSAPMAGVFVGLGALMVAGGASLVIARGMQRRRTAQR